MKDSAQRIRTSHVGRLPAPSGFAETALRLARGTRPLKPGEVGSMRESTRERDVFRTLYADMDRVGTIACVPGERPRPPHPV